MERVRFGFAYQTLLDEFRELGKGEKVLKAYYEANGVLMPDELVRDVHRKYAAEHSLYPHLHHRAQAKETLEGMARADLNEYACFIDSDDITVSRHWRYVCAAEHTHEFFEMLYVARGTCENRIRTRGARQDAATLCAGDILILAPGARHAISTTDGILLNYLVRNSTFESCFLANIPPDNALRHFFVNALYGKGTAGYIIFRTGEDARVRETLSGIYLAYRDKEAYYNKLMNACLSYLFIILLRDFTQTLTVGTSLGQGQQFFNCVPAIIDYMKQHCATATLGDIAAHFSFDYSYMCRQFKRCTDHTMLEALTQMRMERAQMLLTETALSVDEVAESVGYTDTSAFIKRFKQHCGLTPQGYRRAQGKGAPPAGRA